MILEDAPHCVRPTVVNDNDLRQAHLQDNSITSFQVKNLVHISKIIIQ